MRPRLYRWASINDAADEHPATAHAVGPLRHIAAERLRRYAAMVTEMAILLPPWATASRKTYTVPVTLGRAMPPSARSQPTELVVSGYDMAWAAITSGRPPSLVPSVLTLAGRDYRSWRIWASLGFLEDDGATRLRRSPEFAGLDPTEKGHLNYALAGALSKAYAAKKLQTPWLAHLSLAARSGHVLTFAATPRGRPDYFGVNTSGDFLVAEAKGRIVVRQDLRNALDAKTQTAAVTHVGGKPVIARYGIAVTANGSLVTLYATDPAAEINVMLTAPAWIRSYYRMVVEVSESIAQVRPARLRGDDDRLREWRAVDLVVPSSIREWASSEDDPATNWDSVRGIAAQGEVIDAVATNPDFTAFVDTPSRRLRQSD